MGIYIKKEELEALREKYPKGCRVELVKMDDPYREMPPGLRGVVTGMRTASETTASTRSITTRKGWMRYSSADTSTSTLECTARDS